MRIELTRNQQKVLDYLKLQIKESGISPSLRTAAGELGISHAAVAQSEGSRTHHYDSHARQDAA